MSDTEQNPADAPELDIRIRELINRKTAEFQEELRDQPIDDLLGDNLYIAVVEAVRDMLREATIEALELGRNDGLDEAIAAIQDTRDEMLAELPSFGKLAEKVRRLFRRKPAGD